MKNITVFAVLVIILHSGQPVPVQGQQAYAVSVRPLFGLVSGHAEELVYPDGTTIAPLLSELLWNMKPVFYYGVLLDFSQTRPIERWGFFSNISLKQGIPGVSGIHENRDWMSVVNTGLTDYSVHDNHTRELFFFDFTAGLSFPLHRAVLLKTYINVSFIRFSFFGKDGHGMYAREIDPTPFRNSGQFHPIKENPDREQFQGKVISYTQEWLYAAPGVAVSYYFFNNFFAELSFMASPLIVSAALDEHKEHALRPRGTQYRDYMQGGIMIEPGLQLFFAAGKQLAVSWDISWRYISGTRGVTYQRSPIGSGTYLQGGEAGAGLSIITTGFGFNIRL